MPLRLTVLGSGTALPHPRRRPPAHLVQAGDSALLLDCGAGCTTGLAAAGVGLERLTGVALTHLHPDHLGELLPLLFALAIPLGPERQTDLLLWGPAGTRAYLEGLEALYGHWVRPRTAGLQVIELGDGDRFDAGVLRVTAFTVTHREHSLAYRLEVAGRSLCYSGDSGACPGLVAAAAGVDCLLVECAALEAEAVETHLSAREVGALAAGAGCGQVVLTHLYEHVEASDPLPRVRERFGGPVRLAEDGLAIDI